MRGPRCSRFLLQHPQHFCSAFDFLFVAAAAAAAAGLQAGPYRPSPVQSTPLHSSPVQSSRVRSFCAPSKSHSMQSWTLQRKGRGGAAVVAFVSKFACDVTNF